MYDVLLNAKDCLRLANARKIKEFFLPWDFDMHAQNKKIKKNVESLRIQRYHLILQWEVKFESLFPLKKRKKKKKKE